MKAFLKNKADRVKTRMVTAFSKTRVFESRARRGLQGPNSRKNVSQNSFFDLRFSKAHGKGEFRPNFTRSPAKLLIFLHTAPFCSHNFFEFHLDIDVGSRILRINGDKIHTQTPTPHTRKPLPRVVVSTRLDNRVIRIAYVVTG